MPKIGIVVDEGAGLPHDFAQANEVEVVRGRVEWPELESLPGENVYQKMREAEKRGIKTFVKTAMAVSGDYLNAFRKQLKKFDKILCIVLSAKLSGSYNGAFQAKNLLSEQDKERIIIFDTQSGFVGEALFVLKTIDLIKEKRNIEEILEILKGLIHRTPFFGIFGDPKWLRASGRINSTQANWIRRMKKINLHPIITLKNGIIKPGGVVLAKDEIEALFKKVSRTTKSVRAKGGRVRALLSHADSPELALRFQNLLEGINIEVPMILEAPLLVGAHTGPGTFLVAWQELD